MEAHATSARLADLSVIGDDYDQRSQAHYGLVLADPSRYPRGSPGTIGRMVTALDRLLRSTPKRRQPVCTTGSELSLRVPPSGLNSPIELVLRS